MTTTFGMVAVALAVGFLVLLFTALEGAVCLAMAYPVMLGAGLIGSPFGRSLALLSVPVDSSLAVVLLGLPLGAWIEQGVREPDVREVRTAVEIAAPPEVVWEHVVSFSELPEPCCS